MDAKVREIMTENPICCVTSTPLEEVARMMVENDCGAIPVVEDQEGWKPVGIITDRDLTCRAVAEGRNPLDLTAGDIMTPAPVTVGAETSLEASLGFIAGPLVGGAVSTAVAAEQGALAGYRAAFAVAGVSVIALALAALAPLWRFERRAEPASAFGRPRA